ncbi:MAG: pentapeptide repeat-containing protein [Methanothrix sp.]|nr:pentapeptide repeat-containing protein [Methanothrix sp.]
MDEKFIVAGATVFAQEACSLARIWIWIVLLAFFAVGLSVGANDRVVPASRILEQIRAGEPIEYDGFTITGDLDLDGLDDYSPFANEALCYPVNHTNLSEKKKIMASLIRITNCTIKGEVNFNNTRFDRPFDLEDTRFEGHAGFRGAVFQEDVNLSNVQFSKNADFLGSIFRKSASFNDAQFLGYADFEGACLKNYTNLQCDFANIADFKITHFDGTACFDGAEFNDTAYFDGVEFNQTANFNDVVFNRSVYINDADFNGNAYFNRAVFNGTVDFIKVNFCRHVDFVEAEFKYSTLFLEVSFKDTSNFKNAEFNEDANFKGSSFNGIAYFSGSRFSNNANFDGVFFNRSSDFILVEINGSASFHGAVFNDTVLFDSVILNRTTDFGEAVFKGSADFSGGDFNITDFSDAEFNKEAHFEEAQFAGKASFNNVRFYEDALFEGADFNGKLSLTRTRYDKLYIRWYNITSLVYDDAAYMSLMKNFKDLGYYEDYDSCYFQYRKAHRDQPWPTVDVLEQFVRKKFIDYPLEWFYGYGTKPFNAALFSLGIVLIFAAFWWGIGLGGLKDKTGEKLKDSTGKSQEDDDEWLDGDITDILAFSTTVFLSGTKLFIDPPPLPRIEGRSRSLIKKAFILERVLGALFSVLFFIAISGTIARAS